MKKILTIFTTILLALNAVAVDYVFSAGNGLLCSWGADDAVGVFPVNDIQSRFFVQNISSTDNSQAQLSVSGMSLKGLTKYNSLYPYSASYYVNDNVSSALPISYPDLTQSENGNASHLSVCDFMTAGITTANDGGGTFKYTHLGAVLRLSLMTPDDALFSNATLEVSQSAFMKTGILNLDNNTLAKSTFDNKISLNLNSINVKRGQLLTLYFIIPATSLSSAHNTVTLTSTDGRTYYCTFNCQSYAASSVYNIGRTLVRSNTLPSSRERKMRNIEPAGGKNLNARSRAMSTGTLGCTAGVFSLALNDVNYSPLPPIPGDANGDDKLDELDITTIEQYIIGKTPARFVKEAADANGDGQVNVGDITVITNILKNK